MNQSRNFTLPKLLNTLSELADYYRIQVNLESNLVLSAWIEKLEEHNFSDQEIESAAKRCIQELKFFPSPLEFVERVSAKSETNLKLKSYQQWGVLLDCLAHARSLPFKDLPLDNGARWALKLIGGLRLLSEQDSRQLLFVKKEWQELYVQYYQSVSNNNNQSLLPQAKEALEENPYEFSEYFQQIQHDWHLLIQRKYDEVSDFTLNALAEQKLSPEEISSADYVIFLSAINRYKLKTAKSNSEQSQPEPDNFVGSSLAKTS
ncbi:UNVERIFIED_CONTAM: hypothetical protein BEN50_11395 [Euhalothece sp. KZN 001]